MHRNASSILPSATKMLKSKINVRVAGGDDSIPMKLHSDFRSTPLYFSVTTYGELRFSTVSPGTKFIVSIVFNSDLASAVMNITLADDSLLCSASLDDLVPRGKLPPPPPTDRVGVYFGFVGLRVVFDAPFDMHRVSHTTKRASSVSQKKVTGILY